MSKIKNWVTWTLQTLSYMGGIAIAIKELIPKPTHNKGLFDRAVVDPNVKVLILTALAVLLITGILKAWREKQ